MSSVPAASASPSRPRYVATGGVAACLAFALAPKCGLCAAAWLLALAGLGVEPCGADPSWALLLTATSHRLGLPTAALGTLGVLLVGVSLFASWKLLARLSVRCAG
jgi:hypothetical protein